MLDVRTLSSVNTTTNHILVIAIIQRHIQPKKKCKTKTIEKINVEVLSDKTKKYLYQQRLSQKIENRPILPKHDVQTACNKIQTNINAAKEVLGKRKVINCGKPNNTPWFTYEVKNFIAKKRKSYLK